MIDLNEIFSTSFISLDTETTGLEWFRNDRPFAIIIANSRGQTYFDFSGGLDSLDLPFFNELKAALESYRGCIFMHNAKFDIHMLETQGIYLNNQKIYDTEVMAKLLDSSHLKYSLASCAERFGLKKSTEVDEFIKEHKLFETSMAYGKKRRKPRYDKVPRKIIESYAKKDAEITLRLGLHYLDEISKNEKLSQVLKLESDLIPVLVEMESNGIRVDVEYCKEMALKLERAMEIEVAHFVQLTGVGLVDSAKYLAPILKSFGDEVSITEKGNESINDDALARCESEVAKIVKRHRELDKKLQTYFNNYLYYATNDRIHPNFKQIGASATGRMSCTEPNLQNVPSSDDEYSIRRAFIADPNHIFVELDFKAQEFRLMIDYCHAVTEGRFPYEAKLAQEIQAGLDPHQQMANEMGVTRKQAKTLNFGIPYGMGVDKLAAALGVGRDEAYKARKLYFEKYQGIRSFLDVCNEKAHKNGQVKTWFGRVLKFPDKRYTYRAGNAVIQGGSADMLKIALHRLAMYIKEMNLASFLVCAVHDSILISVHLNELSHVVAFSKIMSSVYPHQILPQAVSVKISNHSWNSMQECQINETGIPVQAES